MSFEAEAEVGQGLCQELDEPDVPLFEAPADLSGHHGCHRMRRTLGVTSGVLLMASVALLGMRGRSNEPPLVATPAIINKAGKGKAPQTSKMTMDSLDDGSEFSKCVKVQDWNSKKWDEEVEVTDRNSKGCCPKGFVFGAQVRIRGVGSRKHVKMGGGVICGFNEDKSGRQKGIKWRGQCQVGKCIVVKPKYSCSGGSKALLTGKCPDNKPPVGCSDSYNKDGTAKSFKAGYMEYKKKNCNGKKLCETAGGFKTRCCTCGYGSNADDSNADDSNADDGNADDGNADDGPAKCSEAQCPRGWTLKENAAELSCESAVCTDDDALSTCCVEHVCKFGAIMLNWGNKSQECFRLSHPLYQATSDECWGRWKPSIEDCITRTDCMARVACKHDTMTDSCRGALRVCAYKEGAASTSGCTKENVAVVSTCPADSNPNPGP